MQDINNIKGLNCYAFGETLTGQPDDIFKYLWSQEGIDELTKFFSSPSDCIYSIKIVPIGIEKIMEHSERAMEIKLGTYSLPFLSGGFGCQKLTSQYYQTEFTVGPFNPVYNNFLDFNPYSKMSIYLPFVGYQELDINNFVNKSMKVIYTYDVLNCLCVVNIYPGNGTTYLSEPLYVFSGSFGTDYPFASASRNVGGALSSTLGLGTSIFTGNVGGVVSGLAGTIMASTQTTYSRGGNLSGSHSYMGNYSFKKPFVIIEYPNAWADNDVRDKYGKKVNITLKGDTTLENFSGYTVLERIHLSNIYSTVNNNTFYATQSEMDEIESILTSGFNI